MRNPIFHILLLGYFQLVGQFSMAQQDLTMQNGRFRICNGNLIDSEAGKNKGYYDHNENYILTLSMPGAKKITLDFQSFCTEVDNDVLSIFDGKDTNATLIGRHSGTKSLGKISSTDSFITLHFVSDKSVSCTGWSAKILNDFIPPTAAKLSISKSISCNDTAMVIKTDKPVWCDSLNVFNTYINGNIINNIRAINCINGKSSEFELSVSGLITQNGTYRITHRHGYRDFCDSVYPLESTVSFTVANCPITVNLTANKDTICLGDCLNLNAQALGGNASKYQYKWNLPGQTKSTITICPVKSMTVKVTVTDGNAIPGTDSIEIIVLDPPKIQNDTQVCYYNSPFKLNASPNGGRWFGKGITNSNDGTFNPRLAYGTNKVWYQIGTCSDTMQITSTIPWNLENVYCPGTNPSPVYWFGPTGGTWTGANITTDGIFTPDSIGVFTVEYEWKGCKSNKTIRVEPIVVKSHDTTCESAIRDTLDFNPKGLIIRNFKGLLNAYWGWYNPNNMGGPGNYDIIFQARGTCRDTQKLTVLPCFAGKDDTICPQTPIFNLSGFRRSSDAIWEGKGIIDAKKGTYDPSWSKGLDAVDTIWLVSSRCSDYKLIHILSTRIYIDSLRLCPEIKDYPLSDIPRNKSDGIWSGLGLKMDSICVKCNGPGSYLLSYSKNGCSDTLNYQILPFAEVPKDTQVCENIPQIKLNQQESGYFFGIGIDSMGNLDLTKRIADSILISFQNKDGCQNQSIVWVKKPAIIDFQLAPKSLCFKDTSILPIISPINGDIIYRNSALKSINTYLIGSGQHMLIYSYNDGVCESMDSWSLVVNDTLKVDLTATKDRICPGEYVTINALPNGGIGNYQFSWSNGQSGNKTLVNPTKSTTYTVTVSDFCSENAVADIPITVNPPVWLDCVTSDSVCVGSDGFIVLKLANKAPANIQWSHTGTQKGDTMFLPSGNIYKAFVTEAGTGCYKDTNIFLPSFKAVSAQFSVLPPLGGNCYTPLDENLKVFWSNQDLQLNGSYLLNNRYVYPLKPFIEIPFEGNLFNTSNNLKLFVNNSKGCLDTMALSICYKDTILSFLPSAFTPDGDGLNDEWKWYFYGANEIKVLIYNRWGQVVFESKDIQGSWNGMADNEECMEGLYVVHIVYKGEKAARRAVSKSIMLLRNK